jgi:hypothetical protein
MCPQAPRSSPEYSHKAGLQTVITEKPLQIRPVIHPAAWGLLQGAKFQVGLRVGRGRGTGRPRRKPSSCSVLDEGWKLLVASAPLVQRDWRRHRAKGSVFAFAPTMGVIGIVCRRSYNKNVFCGTDHQPPYKYPRPIARHNMLDKTFELPTIHFVVPAFTLSPDCLGPEFSVPTFSAHCAHFEDQPTMAPNKTNTRTSPPLRT